MQNAFRNCSVGTGVLDGPLPHSLFVGTGHCPVRKAWLSQRLCRAGPWSRRLLKPGHIRREQAPALRGTEVMSYEFRVMSSSNLSRSDKLEECLCYVISEMHKSPVKRVGEKRCFSVLTKERKNCKICNGGVRLSMGSHSLQEKFL